MKDKTGSPTPPADSTREHVIKPVPFSPGNFRHKPKLRSRLKWLVWIALGLIVAILSYAVWFVFTAKQVVIKVAPEPERVVIRGTLFAPRYGDYYLLRPGSYVLKASKKGYHRIEKSFSVSGEKSQELAMVLEKLPGRLTLTAYRDADPSTVIEGATVLLDGQELGVTPLSAVEIKPGLRQLVIKADTYQDLEIQLNIEGMGITQAFNVGLVPDWAKVAISAVPLGAEVSVDGKPVGKTPLSLKLLAGTYELKISAETYKTWQTQLTVQANQPQVLGQIQLEPAEGLLALRTDPPGANVTIDGVFVGQTPIKSSLQPDSEHLVKISKAGYEKIERTVTVGSAGVRELNLELAPRKGIVHFKVIPPDAELFVNEKSRGAVPQSLSLIAVKQRLKIAKQGYEPYQTEVTPRPGFPQEVEVALKKKTSAAGAAPGIIKAANGYSLVLIHPTSFTMGSSRREQGRRSNETLRNIALERPFYMGMREVTNKEFREYLAAHKPGSFKGNSVSLEEQPVVQISWDQAALFCNWLSEKENLPTVYSKREGKVVSGEALSTGYRLPTEAEWEYCARFSQHKALLMYPWGDTFPPRSKTLNIADESAKDLLPVYLEKYDDGYPVAAPPAAFDANALGLYDLGGNVAEWCHDYYSIYSHSPTTIHQDPPGPQEGKHHVVRGSSWKDASISVLRSSYRGYSNDKRIDLGFRICRYADNPSEK